MLWPILYSLVGSANAVLLFYVYDNAQKDTPASDKRKEHMSVLASLLLIQTIAMLRNTCDDPVHKFGIKCLAFASYITILADVRIMHFLQDSSNKEYKAYYFFVLINLILVTVLNLAPLMNIVAGTQDF
jgi:hypothetical protein